MEQRLSHSASKNVLPACQIDWMRNTRKYGLTISPEFRLPSAGQALAGQVYPVGHGRLPASLTALRQKEPS